MNTTTETKQLDGFELAKDISTWLAPKDCERARRLIAYHQRKATIAQLQRMIDELSAGLGR